MTTDKTCAVNLHNLHGWELDDGMLEAVFKRCARLAQECKLIDIYPMERIPADAPAYRHPGFLEWHLRVHFRSGTEMTIGCVQRQPGEPVEFHS